MIFSVSFAICSNILQKSKLEFAPIANFFAYLKCSFIKIQEQIEFINKVCYIHYYNLTVSMYNGVNNCLLRINK